MKKTRVLKSFFLRKGIQRIILHILLKPEAEICMKNDLKADDTNLIAKMQQPSNKSQGASWKKNETKIKYKGDQT